jgi:hypothetical protein
MKRFIAILTLALTAALSADEAFAQISGGGGVNDYLIGDVVAGLYSPDTVDGIIAIIALAATETGIIDPDDCPTVGKFDSSSTSTQMMPDDDMGHNLYFDPHWLLQKRNPNDCPDLVDLWFELVDAGYTEDEAFDLIEMAMDEDGWLVGGGYKLWTDTGATGY